MKADILSKNRNLLFGIAALGVLVVHSIEFVKWPTFLNKLCGFGGVGVYVFAFLSGMGLYVSMSRNSAEGGIRKFYQKRFLRVGLTYLLIAGCWYTIKHMILNWSPLNFLYELSTLSFWLDHKGAWYVAMLIPLYLVYPFLYKILSGKNQGFVITALSSSILLLSFFLYVTNKGLYSHLIQVMNSLFVFVLGNYMGIKLLDRGKISLLWLVISLLAYPVRALIPVICDSVFLGNFTYALLGISVCILGNVLSKILPTLLRRVLEWLGSISLELYLTNIFLIQALNIAIERGMLTHVNGIWAWLAVYFVLCVAGILLSVGSSQLTMVFSKRIIQRL